MAIILIIDRDGQRLGLTLEDGVYVVGREKPAEIVLPDSTVSGKHAELQISGSNCIVRDLGSRNGTFVNGAVARAATAVRPSDELRFGGVKVAITLPEAPATVRPDHNAVSRKIEHIGETASTWSWTTRYWLASLGVVALLLVLFFIVQVYTARVAREQRLLSRYRNFASQYVHLLGTGRDALPAPSLDQSLTEPILVLASDGRILFPAPIGGKARPSPLVNSKTGEPYAEAREGLFRVRALSQTGTAVYSYPVSRSGEIAGYVVAAPARDDDGALSFSLMLLCMAAVLGAIALYFLLTPVTRAVAAEVAHLSEKVSPFASGLVDALPRSTLLPPLGSLAEEIESAIRRLTSHQMTSMPGAAGTRSSQHTEVVRELIEESPVAYCLTDSDYRVLEISPQMSAFREFRRATPGNSLFSDFTTIQSRELVEAMNAPGARSLKIDLSRNGQPVQVTVYTRALSREGHRLYGLLVITAAG